MYRSVVPAIVPDVAPTTLISVGGVTTFDVTAATCPAGHARDTHALAPADEDVPAGQVIHALAPANEYVPAVQLVHAVDPDTAANDPALQLVHAVADVVGAGILLYLIMTMPEPPLPPLIFTGEPLSEDPPPPPPVPSVPSSPDLHTDVS